MIPTANRIDLLDRCDFTLRRERMAAARLPIGLLRELTEERVAARQEERRLNDRDEPRKAGP